MPEIRRFGKKTAIVIDESFFSSLVALKTISDLSNADIASFVAGYDLAADGKLARRKVVFTSLESSVDALTAGIALPQAKFEDQLCRKLRKISDPVHGFSATYYRVLSDPIHGFSILIILRLLLDKRIKDSTSAADFTLIARLSTFEQVIRHRSEDKAKLGLGSNH